MKEFHSLIHALHIYLGLLISPFILIFSISVLAFNHMGFLNRINPVKSLPDTRTKLISLPHDTTTLLTVEAITSRLGISGEIDFISENDDQISFPVNKPLLKTRVAVNIRNDSVVITRRSEGAIRAMTWLHIMPGPHNAAIRGNSPVMKMWRPIADTVVYLLSFLVLSGIYLWYFLQFERDAGKYAIFLGILFFAGLLHCIF